uniref:Actin like 8 n=1 Tax=Monodelphis domestica TaxID=13616 RepID=F7GFD2_MONDO
MTPLNAPGHKHCALFNSRPPLPFGSTFIFLMELSVVIDIGNDWCKAGLGGKNYPTIAVPEVIGYQSFPENPGPSNPQTRKIVGFNNLALMKELPTEFPIVRGQVKNWEAMETVLTYAFESLGIKTEDHAILVTGFLSHRASHRMKLLEVMMETFNVPSLYIGELAELCLYGSGILTGLVVHSGPGLTCITPVFNGKADYTYADVFQMAGIDISLLLHKALFNQEMDSNNLPQVLSMNSIKEMTCYVSRNPSQKGPAIDPIPNFSGTTVLPDGKIIRMTKELCTYPDIFFQTSQHDFPSLDLSSKIIKSILNCKAEERAILASHVVLSGGNTLFPGFPERLKWELNATRPLWFPADVVSKPNRVCLSWVGASILSCLSNFESHCVTKMEYGESEALIASLD